MTVAIPVYRRLEYLENALNSVARQDYAAIELLVSDNGIQGRRLEDMLERQLAGRYRLRANSVSVSITDHYNQLVDAATGEYFVLLCDDDELGTAHSISKLVDVLRQDPDVGVALPKLEVIDAAGSYVPRRGENEFPPARMRGHEFVRVWCEKRYDFVCFVTNMARTDEIRRVGRYPVFPRGTAVDNALLLRLVLGRKVAFVPDAVFRYRVYEESHGLALPDRELAVDLRAFLDFVDEDPVLREYRESCPLEWQQLRPLLVEKTWRTYRHRWKYMYQGRLSTVQWLRAGFRMPWFMPYYKSVVRTVSRRGLRAVKRGVQRWWKAGGT